MSMYTKQPTNWWRYIFFTNQPFWFQKSENHTHLYIMRKAILSSYHLNSRFITSLLPHHHLTHRIIIIIRLPHYNCHHQFFCLKHPLSDTLSPSPSMSRYTHLFLSLFWVHNKDHHLNYYGRNTHRHRYTTHNNLSLMLNDFINILRTWHTSRSIVLQEGLCGQSPFESIGPVDISDWIRSYFPSFFLQLITPIRVDMLHMMSFVKPHLYPLQLEFSTLGGCSTQSCSNTLNQGLYPHLLLWFFIHFSIFWNKSNALTHNDLHETMPTLERRESLLDTTKLTLTAQIDVMILLPLLVFPLIVLFGVACTLMMIELLPTGIGVWCTVIIKYERGIGEEIRTMVFVCEVYIH